MTHPTDDNFDPTEPSYLDETTERSPIDAHGPDIRERYDDLAAPDRARDSDYEHKVKGSLAGGTWIALILGTLLLILLLVFIMQNQQSVDLHLFAWDFSFPAGVGFLLAAIAGALIMALVGGVRMFELRRQIKRAG